MKIKLYPKLHLVFLALLIILFPTCNDGNKNGLLSSKAGADYVQIHGGVKFYNHNPYLTVEYLENRRENGKYTFIVIDTICIENPVKLIYKKNWLQISMITSEEEFDKIDFDTVTPWELLSQDAFYLEGLGGPYHPFLTDYNTLELPDHDFDRDGYDLSENYAVFPLLQKLFLFVIIDEATYNMTNAVSGFSAPITAHSIGLPLKMAYSINTD